jgi:hypothetical protein
MRVLTRSRRELWLRFHLAPEHREKPINWYERDCPREAILSSCEKDQADQNPADSTEALLRSNADDPEPTLATSDAPFRLLILGALSKL